MGTKHALPFRYERTSRAAYVIFPYGDDEYRVAFRSVCELGWKLDEMGLDYYAIGELTTFAYQRLMEDMRHDASPPAQPHEAGRTRCAVPGAFTDCNFGVWLGVFIGGLISYLAWCAW